MDMTFIAAADLFPLGTSWHSIPARSDLVDQFSFVTGSKPDEWLVLGPCLVGFSGAPVATSSKPWRWLSHQRCGFRRWGSLGRLLGRLLDREAGEKKQVDRAQGMLEVFLSISLVVGIYNFSLCRPVKRC